MLEGGCVWERVGILLEKQKRTAYDLREDVFDFASEY